MTKMLRHENIISIYFKGLFKQKILNHHQTAKLNKTTKSTTIVPQEPLINLRWAPYPKSIKKSRSTTVQI